MVEIVLISGEIQSGKTRLCLDLWKTAREAGFLVGGIISPAVFDGSTKTAIDVLDLKSGIQKRLADLKMDQKTGLETQKWSFFPDVIEWGNVKLRQAVPCDLLIVDELGPLEFQRAEGFVKGFEAVDSGDFRAAAVVVRPSLIGEASRRFKISRIIDLGAAGARVLTGKDFFNTLNLD